MESVPGSRQFTWLAMINTLLLERRIDAERKKLTISWRIHRAASPGV